MPIVFYLTSVRSPILMTEPSEIYQLGHPLLRTIAQPIANPEDTHIQTLIQNLIETAQLSHGVGIAAPQIGQLYRLLIVTSRPNLRYPNAPKMEPTPLINPQIVSHSDTQLKGWEGCLSVPGIRGLVPRFTEIEVEYIDQKGKHQRQIFTDFVARIIQHEFDHLEGKLFIDRVESTQELMSESEYHRQIVAHSIPSQI